MPEPVLHPLATRANAVKRTAVAIACSALVLGVAPVSATSWLAPTNVSGNIRAFADPGSVVSNGNTVGIAYVDATLGSSRVRFRRSTDGGATFGSAKAISGTTGQPLNVSMAASGSQFDIVWTQLESGSERLWYAHSSDSGATWPVKKGLSPSTGENVYDPRVARDGSGRVAVVWAGGPSGDQALWIRVSTDGGTTFASRTAIETELVPPSAKAAVAIGGFAKIHVVYYGGDTIWYRRSGTNGASWTSPIPIAGATDRAASPGLAAAGQTVIVAFNRFQDGDGWVRYRRSTNNGTDWGTAKDLTAQSGNETGYVNLSTHAGHWRAMFTRCLTAPCSDDAIAVYLRKSDDGGVTWTSGERVTPTTHHNSVPVGAAGSTKVVVVWKRQDSGGSTLQVWARRQS